MGDCIYNGDGGRGGLEESDARSPVVLHDRFGVYDDLVRERVGVGGSDGWNVVLVAIHDGDDLVRGLFHGFAHCAADLEDISLGPGLCERHIQRPLLPADIFVCLAKEVRLPPFLLEELYRNLASASGLVRAIYGAAESMRLLLNERFQVYIVDGGEGEVEQVAGEGGDGGEVSVKEDGVQYGLDDFLYARRIREDVEIVLWTPSWFHAGLRWLGIGQGRAENPAVRRAATRRERRIATAQLRCSGPRACVLPVSCRFHA